MVVLVELIVGRFPIVSTIRLVRFPYLEEGFV